MTKFKPKAKRTTKMSPIQQELNDLCRAFPAPPFLFVGSGLPRRYCNTKCWADLLKGYTDILCDDPLAFWFMERKVRKDTEDAMVLPTVASQIEEMFQERLETDRAFREERPWCIQAIKDQQSPFKADIAQQFRQVQVASDLSAALKNEIQFIKDLSYKSIAGVITTNYDGFIESMFPKFTVYRNQTELMMTNTTGIAEIYKIHGCCTNPESIVITAKDYCYFTENLRYLAAKLLTVFVENPIVFLGYSLDDPHIRKILYDISFCVPQEQREFFCKRLLFVNWQSDVIEPFLYRNGTELQGNPIRLPVTALDTNSLQPVFQALTEVQTHYEPRVLRMLKKDIYTLVRTQKSTGTVCVKNLDKVEDSPVEVVVGVGVLQEYGVKG